MSIYINVFRAHYTASAVLAGFLFAIFGSLILFIIFCTLRPRHNVVYAPKIKYADEKTRPQPLSKHPLSWVKYVLFTAKEDDYLQKSGLDAVVYIRFTAMCRNIFAILSIFGILVIIPINVVYNRRSPNAQNVSNSDAFILTTPILLSGKVTIAHVTLSYIFDGIICYFLWRNYEKIIEMRRRLFLSEDYQNALFMRTVMLTEVPKAYKTDDGLIRLMETIKQEYQRPIQNASCGRDVGQLNKYLKRYNRAVLKLESVLAKYLKNPDKLPDTKPLMKPYREDRKFLPEGTKKIDSIDYLTLQIQKYEALIIEAREDIDTNKTLPYGFVSYECAEDCHFVAQKIASHNIKKHGLKAALAPRPEDIIWDNIILTTAGRRNKQFWGNFFFFLLTLAWIAPNAFIGAFLSNLSRIGTLWPPFNTFISRYPVLFSIIQGIIAPLVTALIFLLMPAIMRKMSHWQGKITKHDREIDVTRKLYSFFVFNNIFVFTLFSVVWAIVSQIIYLVNTRDNLSFSIMLREIDVAYKISTAIMSASSFWVMYILRVNFGAVLDLLQIFSLVWRGFQRHFMAPTPRQQIMWTAPQHFNYAAYYNWMLFYSTIALCFAMVQPLVLVVITVYFSLDLIYKKYGLMYIFVTKAESDGLFWPLLFNSFLFATIFGNLVLFIVVWVQGGWKYAAGMAPLLPLLIAFKIVSSRRHNPRFFFFLPTEQERSQMDSTRSRTALSDTSSTALARRYRNPVLDSQLMVPMIHSKAQHILPQITSLNSLGTDPELDPESAFMSMGNDERNLEANTAYDPAREESAPRQSRVRSYFLDGRFDIVDDHELDYSHMLRISKIEPVPDDQNPYLNASFGSNDTKNDAAIAVALSQPEKEWHDDFQSNIEHRHSSDVALAPTPDREHSNPFLSRNHDYTSLDGGAVTTHYYGNTDYSQAQVSPSNSLNTVKRRPVVGAQYVSVRDISEAPFETYESLAPLASHTPAYQSESYKVLHTQQSDLSLATQYTAGNMPIDLDDDELLLLGKKTENDEEARHR